MSQQLSSGSTTTSEGSRKRPLELDNDDDSDSMKRHPTPHSLASSADPNHDVPLSSSLAAGVRSGDRHDPLEINIEPHERSTENKRQLTTKAKASKVMTNSVVLKEIAKLLPVGRLLDLRQTCTHWNLDFIPEVKKKHSPIQLRSQGHRADGEHPSGSEATTKGPTHKSIGNLTKTYGLSQNIPFTRFQFRSNISSERGSAEQEYQDRHPFREFLSSFENTIKSLEIIWYSNSTFSVRELRELIFKFTPHLEELRLEAAVSHEQGEGEVDQVPLVLLSKLKRLEVEVWKPRDGGPQPARAITRLMSDVIQSAVGLEHLDLNDSFDNMAFTKTIIAELIHNPKTRSHIHELKILKAKYLTQDDIQILVDLAPQNGEEGSNGLRLSSFTGGITYLTLNNPDNEEEGQEKIRLLRTFLATQAPYLKELEILFDRTGDGFSRATPCALHQMAHLQKLKLIQCGFLFDGDAQGVEGKFMDTFPKLEQFSYRYWNGPQLENFVDRFYHAGIKTLEIKTNVGEIMGFASFQSIFPSLIRLELKLTEFKGGIHINAKEFAQIWSTWPALEFLQVSWNARDLDLDLDALVTGIPRKELERLRYEHKIDYAMGTSVLELEPDTLHAVVEKYKKWPSIHDLKRLREFKITFSGQDKPQLTDMGGYFGIALASPTLQEVVIQGSGKNLVSERCLKFIKDTFGPLVVIDL